MDLKSLQSELIADLLGVIRPLMEDEDVSEVMINGPYEIYAEKKGKVALTELQFADEQDLEAATRSILQFVGKALPPGNASLEARLPDGSRVHIVRFLKPPVADKTINIAIRKFRQDKLMMGDLVGFDAIPQPVADLLFEHVSRKSNIIVSGGTGTGKTTMLNCLSEAIGDAERIIVIEDATELQLKKPHVLQMEVCPPDHRGEGGLSVRDLFKASLRMRPDRVIVGECRGGEAFDMIQAMSSGHSGSISTIHADTALGALNRIETLSMMAGVSMPLTALRRQIAMAVNVIVQISRMPDGKRLTTSVSEVTGFGDAEYDVQELYRRAA